MYLPCDYVGGMKVMALCLAMVLSFHGGICRSREPIPPGIPEWQSPPSVQAVKTFCTLVKRVSQGGKIKESEAKTYAKVGGYLLGLLDGLAWTKLDGKVPPFELPPKTQFEDVVDSIGRYIDRYPEQMTNPTSLIVTFALMESYPNRKSPARPPDPKDWPAIVR